jgi:MSHA biogenesis protein MshE
MAEHELLLGELLVKKQIITADQLQIALGVQKKSGEKIGKILIDLGFVPEKIFLQLLAEQLQIPFIELSRYELKHDFSRQLPESYARQFHVILLAEDQNGFLVGMEDPLDVFAIDEIALALKRPVTAVLVSHGELNVALDLIYRRTEAISDFAEKLNIELKGFQPSTREEGEKKQSDTAVSNLLYSLLEDAVQVGASDIHIEPAENILRIRMRVDGILQEQVIEEKSIASALSQRLKLMAGLNMAEKRIPQDGHLNVLIRNLPIDIRLSTMPVQYGESVVLRLLNKASQILTLEAIGMNEEMLRKFRKLIHLPYGLILVTGPTGSGKTTTLYSALTEVNDVKKNIVTIEDPVEYRLDRINQIQVNADIGLTFARILRSTLRQDPNIILVGEIRDQETASIALRAALTGHLVLASLHTNDAASAPLRLIDMGVENYLVAATMRGVLAQRLVRRVCSSCSADYVPTEQEKIFFSEDYRQILETTKFRKGIGCSHCGNTGYKGRLGIFELLDFDVNMIDAVRNGTVANHVHTLTKEHKFKNLVANAFDFACRGATTLNEVLRLAGEVG